MTVLHHLSRLAVATFLLMAAHPAKAELILKVVDTSAYAGSTGNSLYVTVQNTGPPITLGGFAFEITAEGQDISFSNVSTGAPPGLSYLFDGHSLFGPDITLSDTTQTISAADNYDVVDQGTLMDTGSIFGLGIVSYDVAAAAQPEIISVSFSAYPSTSFSDANNNTIDDGDVQKLGGTITILAPLIPEPASFFLLATGIGLFGLHRIKRRTRRK